MAKDRTLNVQTPGAPAPAPSAPVDPVAAAAADEKLIADAPDLAMPGATELPPDLQSVVDNAIARGIAQGLAKAAPAAQTAKPAKAPLPRYADVEASKPKDPVLTDEGWFVPATYGAPPAKA